MSGKIQLRLAVLAALAALVAVLVPAGLASGNDESVTGPGGIIYLSMGKSSSSDVITFDDLSQSIPTKKNDCTTIDALNPGDENSILVVEELNALSLGEGKDHIGTLGPNDGSGEPCALASSGNGTNGLNEGISVKLGEAAGDVLMSGFSVDVRLKGTGATVVATFYDVDGLPLNGEGQAFSFTQQADSGPDSADNYRWTVEPGFEFHEVRFEADAGSFSLGGGVESDEAGAFDSDSFASQFQTVRVFDGDITCSETVEISDLDVPEILGDVTLHSMDIDTAADGTDGDSNTENDFVTEGCLLKFFNELVQAFDNDEDSESINEISELAFLPQLTTTLGRYTIEVTVEDQIVTTDSASGQITSLAVLYNAAGDLTFPAGTTVGLQQCETQPPITDTEDPGYDPSAWTGDLGLLPSGETACYYSASVTPQYTTSDGTTYGTEVWKIFFLADPSLRF